METEPTNAFAEWIKTLEETIQQALSPNLPGVSLAIVEAGKPIFAKGYGKANRESGQSMTENTPVQVASISKAVTAWGVLHLAEAYGLDLDEPVNAYLQRWKIPTSPFDSNGVTLRRLLSHSAGLNVPAVPWFPANSTRPALIDVLRGDAGDRGPVALVEEPGTRWSYSGGGYMILQLLIEDISGETFSAYMHSNVFLPLGMLRTTFDRPAEACAGYDENGTAIPPYVCIGEAAGGLYTTAQDFGLFLAAYPAKGSGVIRPNTFAQMATPVIRVELEGVDTGGAFYGLGHGVHQTKLGDTILYHSGGNPGVRAYCLVSIDGGNGLFVMTNSDNGVPLIIEVVKSWGQFYKTDLQTVY